MLEDDLARAFFSTLARTDLAPCLFEHESATSCARRGVSIPGAVDMIRRLIYALRTAWSGAVAGFWFGWRYWHRMEQLRNRPGYAVSDLASEIREMRREREARVWN